MKILVLGATGMAGHTIAIYFKEKGHSVVSATRTPFNHTKNLVGDFFNQDFLKTTLLDGNYDAVLNCIGILNQDAEKNPEKAVYLNSYLPHKIAEILLDTNSKLIHISTDCVFAGNTGPYFEDSICDGKTFYDKSKALGEVIDNKNLTFRNSIIGQDLNQNGIGLFNWFMKQNDIVSGYKGAIWTGVTTLTLAQAIEEALMQNITGLYHLVNNDSISKFDLLSLFNKYFKSENDRILNDYSIHLDKSLRNTRNDFKFIVPSYDQMIAEMKQWLDNHHFLYSHYILK